MSKANVYLLSGGRPPNFRQMTQDIGVVLQTLGVPKPRVAYVGTASGDNPLFFAMMKRLVVRIACSSGRHFASGRS